MRNNRSASPACSRHRTLRFTSRCIESIRVALVNILRALRRKPLRRKLVCFAVSLNLLVWPGPGLLAQDLADGFSKALDVRFAYSSNEAYALRSFYSSLLSLFSSRARQQDENTDTRSLRVRSIAISPSTSHSSSSNRQCHVSVASRPNGVVMMSDASLTVRIDEHVLDQLIELSFRPR